MSNALLPRHYVESVPGAEYISTIACGVGIRIEPYERFGDRLDLTDLRHEVTCEACIEAYETRPQPVTTKDVHDLMRLLQRGFGIQLDDDQWPEWQKFAQRMYRPREFRPKPGPRE